MSASDNPSSSIFDFLPETLAPEATAAVRGRIVSMRAQYIVDFSFSFSGALFDRRKPMTTQLGVHVDAGSHAADMHEVRLSLEFAGRVDDTQVVSAELVYGGLVWTEGTFAAEQLAMALRIDAAGLLYPMARNILLDHLTHVGYPVAIPQPNFNELYDRHVAGLAASH